MKLITINDTPICTASEDKSNADIFQSIKEGLKPSEVQISKSMEFMRMWIDNKIKVVRIKSIPHLN